MKKSPWSFAIIMGILIAMAFIAIVTSFVKPEVLADSWPFPASIIIILTAVMCILIFRYVIGGYFIRK
jgi:uncharacterized integral membrane protein